MDKTTDLNDPATPEQIPPVLRRAADKMREQASELEAAWHDKRAGDAWLIVAKELDRAASRIDAKI